MASTHHQGGSTRTLASVVGRHDGHKDGSLNCVALRHGWTRAVHITAEELAILDYETLEAVLEVQTLKLRPVGVRIFVENPEGSENWSKIRPWKHDGSLQSVLVQEFFNMRKDRGIITRLDVRDGNDRQAEGDTISLRSVGSRILNRQKDHKDGESTTSRRAASWWPSLSRNTSTNSRRARTLGASTDAEDEDAGHEIGADQATPPPLPPKPSFFSLLRPHPKIPNQPIQRRSIFEFFRSKFQAPTPPAKTNRNNNSSATDTPEDQQLMEVEQLRKRGWIPPGLARRQRSLKDRLRAEGLPEDGTGGNRNPFFGSNKSLSGWGSRTDRKKQKAAAAALAGANTTTDNNTDTDNATPMVGQNDDPFADEAGANLQGASEITEEEVDDFFEINRPESMIGEGANGRPNKDRSWSKFKPAKERKNKSKARPEALAPAKGTLGGGADVVKKPRDAFPESPHHRDAREVEETSVD